MPRCWLPGSCFWSSTYSDSISDVLAYHVSWPTTRPKQINMELMSQGAAFQVQIIISAVLSSGTCKLLRYRVKANACVWGGSYFSDFCLFFPTNWELGDMNLMQFLMKHTSCVVLDKSLVECPVICKEVMPHCCLCLEDLPSVHLASTVICKLLQFTSVGQVLEILCLRTGSVSVLVKGSEHWTKVIWKLLLWLSNCSASK